MKDSEEAHYLTENIYKNLASKFCPQVKQILMNGKIYHKTLLATSSAARSYIESLGRLGHDCRTNSRGGTEEIGQAIFKIAEAYKEIQVKFEECTKAIFVDIILPLEKKLESEFRNSVVEQKKYHQCHKEVLEPYTKATTALEKFKKKNQAKGVFDADKEAPFSRAVTKYQERLNEFRIQGLKLAMLEERKYYCFVLSQLASVATVQLHYHDTGLDCLTNDLTTWRQMSSQPHALPRSADGFLRISETFPFNCDTSTRLARNVIGMGQDNGSIHSSPTESYSSPTDSYSRHSMEYSIPQQNSPSQVQPRHPASYHLKDSRESYDLVSNHDSLSLYNSGSQQDDFGQIRTFPDSIPGHKLPYGRPLPRAKSISDLKDHIGDFRYDLHDAAPGTSRRPKSFNEPALIRAWNNSQWAGDQFVYGDQLVYGDRDHSAHSGGRNHSAHSSGNEFFSPPSPPLPPPPDDLTFDAMQLHQAPVTRPRSHSIGDSLPHLSASYLQPRPANKPVPQPSQKSAVPNSLNYQIPVPPPAPPLPPHAKK